MEDQMVSTSRLSAVRERVQTIRENVDGILGELDAALSEGPGEIDRRVQQIKERVLEAVARNLTSEGTGWTYDKAEGPNAAASTDAPKAKPAKATAKRNTAANTGSTSEFKCDQCDKVLMNANGLKIHIGRQHKNRRRRAKTTATSTQAA